jgi:hypothetical protein
VKERSIRCRDDEVRAFLEGRKTQMRRPLSGPDTADIRFDGDSSEWYCEVGLWHARCPFGIAGDRLWVREAWNMRGIMFGKPASFARYASKRAFHYRATDDGGWRPEWGGWRSAVQMPRIVSRITLKIVNVRIERLQDITHDDAVKEAVKRHDCGGGFLSDARCAFRDEWDSIFGESVDAKTGELVDVAKHPLAWCHNPFVWVIETKVIT